MNRRIEPAIRIDRASGVPFYLQLGEQIRLLVHQGTLRTGDPLPTVRSLAVDLGINANTVARVYRDLQTAGLLRLERGVGTFVADTAGAPIQRREFRQLEKLILQLIQLAKKSGMNAPELARFIETRWKEADHDKP